VELHRLLCAARLDFTDSPSQTLASGAHFILQLQIHAEFLGHAEETSQPDGGIHGDARRFKTMSLMRGAGT